MMKTSVLASAILLLSSWANDARACDCEEPPAVQATVVDGDTVPANLPAFAVTESELLSGWELWQITAHGDRYIPLTIAQPEAPIREALGAPPFALATPTAALVQGQSYRLGGRRVDFAGDYEATFTVGPAAELPAAGGTLVLESVQQRRVPVPDAARCSRAIQGMSARIELDQGESVWASSMLYGFWVDDALYSRPEAVCDAGHPLRHPIWRQRQAVVADEEGGGATVGTHSVVVRAWLPGGGAVLETEPLEFELTAPTPSRPY